MRVRFAAGLLRLWVVLSVLWLAGVGAYTFIAYQDAPQHDLIPGRITFDDMIYEQCWRAGDGKQLEYDRIGNEDRTRIAECERTADRWLMLRSGVLFALGIPIIILVFGWGFVWAFRGFLPAQKP
jgi:hypothetical protein